MINSKNFVYVLIYLMIPCQFSFTQNYYSSAKSLMQSSFDPWLSDKLDTEAGNITNYVGCVAAIASIFIFYAVRKIRIVISINYFLSGVLFLLYLAISQNSLWVILLLRALQGIVLSIFQSIMILCIFSFANEETYGFFGCLVQTFMFFSLVILYLLCNWCSWQVVVIVLAIENFVNAGVIWLGPEISIIPKKMSRDYFYEKKHWFPIFVTTMLMVFQQFSGIGTLMERVPQLLAGIGFETSPALQNVLIFGVSGISSLISSFISDAVGRKGMWSFSSFGLCIGLLVYAITLKIECANWIPTLGSFSYFLFYGLGQGPMPWYFHGELFPASLRVESGAYNMFLNQLFSFVTKYIINAIQDAAGEFGYVLFCAIFSLIAGIFGIIFVKDLSKGETDTLNVF